MNQENKEFEQEITEQEIEQEKPPFVPASKGKRIAAWILIGIMVLGIVNWLLSIAYPHWPQWVMGHFS
ncbi:MAG: hypothetical protein J6K89_08325 [Oscillospiraceae bacterium]|nr:hypothetical protein [Oscillospiraceae bacterium]